MSKNQDLNQPFLSVPERVAPTRTKPFDINDDVELRSQTYEATAYHTLQLRLANAGYVFNKKGKLTDPNAADPILANIAYDLYKNDMLKIQGYKNILNRKFRLVNDDDTINYEQKRTVKQMLLEKEEEPIYVPRQAPSFEREKEPALKPIFTEAYIQRNLGELQAGLESGEILDREEAVGEAQKRFGPNYNLIVPEAESVLNRYYPPEPVAPTELPEIADLGKPNVPTDLKSVKDIAPYSAFNKYWNKLDDDSKTELWKLSKDPKKLKIALSRLEKKFGKNNRKKGSYVPFYGFTG